VAEKRGQAFAASTWADHALNFIEKALSTPHLEENVACAAEGGDIDVVMVGLPTGEDGGGIDITMRGLATVQGFGTGTMNGAWEASIVNVGANALILIH
jgi:hypothetical protein